MNKLLNNNPIVSYSDAVMCGNKSINPTSIQKQHCECFHNDTRPFLEIKTNFHKVIFLNLLILQKTATWSKLCQARPAQ